MSLNVLMKNIKNIGMKNLHNDLVNSLSKVFTLKETITHFTSNQMEELARFIKIKKDMNKYD